MRSHNRRDDPIREKIKIKSDKKRGFDFHLVKIQISLSTLR